MTKRLSGSFSTPPGSPRTSTMRSPQSRSQRKSQTPSSLNSPPLSPSSDRFIPRRSIDMSVAHYLANENLDDGDDSSSSPRAPHSELERALRAALLNDSPMRHPLGHYTGNSQSGASPRPTGPRVLNFSNVEENVDSQGSASLGLGCPTSPTRNAGVCSPKTRRQIPAAPTRILDAPDLVDDYYLNLISWSSTNILAVALGPSVYTWNAESNTVQLLCQLGNGDIVTSVSWMSSSAGGGSASSPSSCTPAALLAVGCNSSRIELWDAHAQKLVRTLGGHSARVASLSWNPTSRNVLSSGGRDSMVINHDVRAAEGSVATLRGHRQEVCGLKWCSDGNTLASGGNENFLCIWDVAMSGSSSPRSSSSSTGDIAPRLTLTDHKAAVKALAWAPFQRSLLASGGGTADRTIKFWNLNSGQLVNSIDTGSQVCALLWSPRHRELLSSHGFSQNQLILWKYPTMAKVKEFNGHTARVLHLDSSPDGSSVVSAAADETLRFWNIFGAPSKPKSSLSMGLGGSEGRLFGGGGSMNMMTIR